MEHKELNLGYEALLATPLGERFLSEFRILARDHWAINESDQIVTDGSDPETKHIWDMAQELANEILSCNGVAHLLINGKPLLTSLESVYLMWYARNTTVEPNLERGSYVARYRPRDGSA